ncbi:nucleoside deaminase [Marinobacter sp. ATCH36]|uniref:nucleoside deaminase n=1 Tax=Marinobacter sp. ATCH36 TaxID=2945106 RepID=UPI0020222E7B|nr:nucleoside deaminase [Marinobacter sp. ATCH36]
MSYSLTDDTDKAFLQEAVRLAIESVDDGGAPFGAVVVHNGKVIARAGNRAKLECDPTAHAEVAAIRLAGKMLGSAHMPEAILYASCEPCPMCLAAAHWARIPRIVFAAPQETANRAGFADGNNAEQLYGQIHPVRPERLGLTQIELQNSAAPFRAWLIKNDLPPF